jgi:hypothetical protein
LLPHSLNFGRVRCHALGVAEPLDVALKRLSHLPLMHLDCPLVVVLQLSVAQPRLLILRKQQLRALCLKKGLPLRPLG